MIVELRSDLSGFCWSEAGDSAGFSRHTERAGSAADRAGVCLHTKEGRAPEPWYDEADAPHVLLPLIPTAESDSVAVIASILTVESAVAAEIPASVRVFVILDTSLSIRTFARAN